ncbi:hypothetical protein EDB83DRAFT_2291529 [Lactarius deliciosus]|nr:hypothetical protein EDB83DRAFT_2291529 [Lactarius deliciosus]
MTNIKRPQANSTLALVKEESTSENSGIPFAQPCLDVPDANIIIRSSDKVNFRVHKSLLSMSSPFFSDLLSLPQPPDDELVDGLPVIQLSEDADLLNSLVSLLYPISPYIPGSCEHAFALLAACQKYDMISIQSYIRAEIKRWPSTPIGAEAFRRYAIASSLGLHQETESAARLTLVHPMTFETLGEGLRSFKGRALCDLIRYRKHCRDNLISCLNSFFDPNSRRQIWAGCHQSSSWLTSFFTSKSVEMRGSDGFTCGLFSPSTIREEFIVALKNHTQSECYSCPRVHLDGQTFCKELEKEFSRELDEVRSGERSCLSTTHPTSRYQCCPISRGPSRPSRRRVITSAPRRSAGGPGKSSWGRISFARLQRKCYGSNTKGYTHDAPLW